MAGSKSDKRPGGRVVKTSARVKSVAPEGGVGDVILVPGPKLRRMIGVSAVTMWRWRQDPNIGFPTATLINGRNYFPWADVQAWLARQQQAATA